MRHRAVVALLAVVVLAIAACDRGGSSSSSDEDGRDDAITIAAERFPSCLNPVVGCPGASLVADQVLPKLVVVDGRGTYRASSVLTTMPSVANGGLRTAPFTVTYHLRSDARWDDGTPITAADVVFTWHALRDTPGAPALPGSEGVTSVEATGRRTAVVRYDRVVNRWPELFGGTSGYVLPAAAFHGRTNLRGALRRSLPFSGRPWKLVAFGREQVVLARNDRYWDDAGKARVRKVTIVHRGDQDTEINSLSSGEVDAIAPEATPGFVKKLNAPDVAFRIGAGPMFEGLWLNLSRPPLDDVDVRRAVMLSIDRQALVNSVIRPDAPGAAVLNCAGWVPTIGDWCDDSQFADVRYDPTAAAALLTSRGWVRGPDGVFQRDGVRLDLELTTTAGNTRRELVEKLVTMQAKEAGIAFHVVNRDSNEFVATALAPLQYTAAVYAGRAEPDPSVSSVYACDQIPQAANGGKGQNRSAWCDRGATALMARADAELDHARRRELTRRVGRLVRDDAVWLPFYQLPVVVAWRRDRVAGPITAFLTSPAGAFYNLNAWHVTS